MTIQHLEAEAEALAKQFESEQRAQAWAKTLEPLLAVLPAELHSYIEYDAMEAPGWRGLNDVWIAAIPGCRIGVSGTLRFYPQKASGIVRNFYSDPVEFYVEYANAYYAGCADPMAALAHAAELAPANLAMEAEAKAKSEAAAAKAEIEKAENSDQAIVRALLLIARLIENR